MRNFTETKEETLGVRKRDAVAVRNLTEIKERCSRGEMTVAMTVTVPITEKMGLGCRRCSAEYEKREWAKRGGKERGKGGRGILVIKK